METRKQRPIRRKGIPVSDQGFDVTFEIVVGRVNFGEGDVTPLAAAMLVIADHHERMGDGGTYRLPGPHEDSQLAITLEVS